MEGCYSLAHAELIDFVPDLPAYGVPGRLLEPSILSGVKDIEQGLNIGTNNVCHVHANRGNCRHAAFTWTVQVVSSSVPRPQTLAQPRP